MIDVVKDNLDSLNKYLCDLYCFIFCLLVYIFFFIFNFKMFANALYCRKNCIFSAPYIFVIKQQHFLNYLSYFYMYIYISVDYFPILFFISTELNRKHLIYKVKCFIKIFFLGGGEFKEAFFQIWPFLVYINCESDVTYAIKKYLVWFGLCIYM